MGVRVGLVLSALALGLLLAAPPTAAADCETGLVVYGRSAFLPGAVPPPSPVRACAQVETTTSSGHTLQPLSDQIYVRLNSDLGASYPTLKLRLEGLGWDNQQFTLHREQSAIGATTYNLREWLSIPEPADGGTLKATARYPSGNEGSVTYQLPRFPPEALTTATQIRQT